MTPQLIEDRAVVSEIFKAAFIYDTALVQDVYIVEPA
jgi:hypothetical protein